MCKIIICTTVFVDNNIVIEGDETLLHYFQEQKRLSDVYDNGVMSYEQ
jgi:hypothetical protein